MKVLKWLLLPATALALASCAASYGTYADTGYGHGGSYADYPYAGEAYPLNYGGIVAGSGWHNHWGGDASYGMSAHNDMGDHHS